MRGFLAWIKSAEDMLLAVDRWKTLALGGGRGKKVEEEDEEEGESAAMPCCALLTSCESSVSEANALSSVVSIAGLCARALCKCAECVRVACVSGVCERFDLCPLRLIPLCEIQYPLFCANF